ncbi:hypothetical protein [Anaerosacchariphilus polymeriproducens]|uniref:DUF5050 domain-containing protein n=1 Tax=Anaerosacchariphilus polymeriproducens TaxID=1812858 RepID=A0A371AZJ3_9FIRM|nr:hypothetical protein [Anaerosacchariphilus polymeriproducens]RDU24900.1 hypothetical protein DWV06_01325 [Anaerosacchariphilus polymeriproducens]
MIKNEAYKFFIKQRVLLCILVFIGLKIIFTIYMAGTSETKPTDSYTEYLKILGGELNDEKTAYIEKQYEKLKNVSTGINDLEEQVALGHITQEEYEQTLRELSKTKQEQTEIKLFYQKYQYALENRKQHYIIDEEGWNEVLTTEKMDILLIFFIFIISIPVFCSEYETEMNYLQLCSRKGRDRLTLIKIVMTCMTSLILCLFCLLCDFMRLKFLYGMDFAYAPIQSLTFFKNSGLKLTLWHLMGLIMAVKILGSIFLTVFIMAISILFHKSLITILVSGAGTILPAFLTSSAKLKYLLPLPTGLLSGAGYFFPDIYKYQLVSSDIDLDVEKYLSFSAFTVRERTLHFLLYFIVILILVALIFIGYKGTLRIFLMLSISCMLLCGCAKSDIYNEEVFYENSSESNHIVTDKYYFYQKDNNILCKNIDTGDEFSIIRDPFKQTKDDFECSLSMFATNQYLYYAKDYDQVLIIYRVNLTNFEEDVIYSKEYQGNHYYNLAVVTENKFYVYDSESSDFYEISRKYHKWNCLGNIEYLTTGDYGNKIYYENLNSQLVKMDVSTGKQHIYNDISLHSKYSTQSSRFCIQSDYCYYTNLMDHDYIYKYCFATGENQLILSKSDIIYFATNGHYFYYIGNDNCLYCMDLETKKTELLMKDVGGKIIMSEDYSDIYQILEKDDKIIIEKIERLNFIS